MGNARDAGNRNSTIASLCRKGLQERTFRARAGAAPLKRTGSCRGLEDRALIPRPRGRGPVEATVAASSPRMRYIHSAPARARPR